jgi:1-acyl-sn-glycerol-3-phosphate acyltransferase
MRRAFHTVYEYLALWFGLGLLGIMCMLWSPVSFALYHLMPRARGGEFGRYMNMFWFRHYLWMLAMSGSCRFDLSALDALRGKPPVIIAPNHPGLIDALLVVSRLPNVVCIMKTELRNNFFMRGGARFAQYISNESMREMIKGATEALSRGDHLLLFPEGSRTVRPPVNAFTALVGLIARNAKVPVQTVFIESSSGFLGKGWPLFRRPSMPITYRVRLGRQIQPPTDVRAFTAELEQYFAAELAGRTVTASEQAAASSPKPAVAANLANRT